MKALILTAAVFMGLGASACPNLTGTYLDTFGYENVIEQQGCKRLSWTIQEQEGSRGSEISLPKTLHFIASGDELGVSDGVKIYKYQKTFYTENSLVIFNRYLLGEELGESYSKIEIIQTSNGMTEYQTDQLEFEEYDAALTTKSPMRSYQYTKIR